MKSYMSDRVFNGTRPLSVERVEKLKRRFGATRPNGADIAAIWYEVAATRTGLGMSKKYVTSAQEYAAEQARYAMNSLTELLYLEGLEDEWL